MAEQDDAPDGVDEPVDAPVEDEAPELNEVEQLASEMGWTPKSNWKGPEEQWKPAADFLRATKDVNKSLRSDLKRLERNVETIARTNAAATQQALDAQRAELEAKFEQAVEDGDKDTAKKVTAQLRKLDNVTVEDAPAPEAADFVRRHASWFNVDKEATTYAMRRAEKYAADGLPPGRQLAAVERDMKQHFPELFEAEEKPATKPAPMVGQPQRAVRTAPREKGYATLPPEARKVCDAWVTANEGRPGVTKDAWAKSYYETQEAANG